MPCDQFVHLHLHSEYSLLDGANRIDRLVARVKELGMTAVAVTDHGNLFGAVAFYQAARAVGVKPILGVEAYVAQGDRKSREHTGVKDGGYHLVLLAENEKGWENLLVLCSEAYLTGFYYKPRIDRELLAKHSEGLIAINGHLGSEIGEHLLEFERSGDERYWEKAVESARWHAETFGSRGTRNAKRADAAIPVPDSSDASRFASSDSRFFIELQHHVPEQNSINKHLIRLAEELGLPLVCDNDAHFMRAEDHDAHDTLTCISMGKLKNEPDRLKYPTEVYVKSPREMRELFERELGEVGRIACDNTVAIAERCSVELPLGRSHAPVVRVRRKGGGNRAAKRRASTSELSDWEGLPKHDEARFGGDLSAWHAAYCAEFDVVPLVVPEEASERDRTALLARAKAECDAALRLLAEAGLVWRYGAGAAVGGKSDPKRARLDRELGILCDKGISPYFLIVWDFVNWGRQNGVPALARGSGVGTMVGYVLGLSNACPVKYGLLFERFTDPDRSEYPDIDIDLCQDGRGRVIEYVRQKYGHVAQIITFGTLKARAAVRDVGRVLNMPLPEVDRLAKLIPEQLGITLERAVDEEPDLRKLCEKDENARRVIETAKRLEGQARHASVHAAGVIVATRPLHELVPLYKQSGSADNEIVTQWDGPTCEKMGLLKMDFLGLRTISVVERAKKLITETLPEEAVYGAVGRRPGDGGPHPLDLDRLTFDDPRVFELFQRGDSTGVFQFESGGMRRLLVEMKPDRLEDLIAANALFRPGPMDLIPDYNRRKHGTEAVPSVHPIVDRFTAETYGVMVYQEQVMQIVHELGGIPLRAAYSLIKAISKKQQKKIDAERPGFIAGAGKQGLGKKEAEELFDLILKFAGYGFNKSHSTGYAIVAYQTAYLKTYFPNHYMAAFLSYESQASKVSEWIPYLDDCKKTRFVNGKVGVEVRPPDVNLSEADFSVVYGPDEPRDALRGHVRFGLGGIKGTGDKAVGAIVGERGAKGAYSSLFDFCERVPLTTVNKATIEALVKSGAFDSVHGRGARSALCATIEQAVSAGQKAALDRASGQSQLFGLGGGPAAKAEPMLLARAAPWPEAEALRQEKETLGFYVSSHPLNTWRAWSGVFTTSTLGQCRDLAQDQRVVIAAIVQSVRTLVSKQGKSAGKKMAVLTLEDLTGSGAAVVFPGIYEDYAHLLESDEPKFMLGRVDHSRGEAQIIVDRLVPIDGVPLEKGRLRLIVREPRLNGGSAAALSGVRGLLNGGSPSGIPVDLIVETDAAWYELRAEPPIRAALEPGLIAGVVGLLGEGSARLAGGVAVELAGDSGRRRGPSGGSGR